MGLEERSLAGVGTISRRFGSPFSSSSVLLYVHRDYNYYVLFETESSGRPPRFSVELLSSGLLSLQNSWFMDVLVTMTLTISETLSKQVCGTNKGLLVSATSR